MSAPLFPYQHKKMADTFGSAIFFHFIVEKGVFIFIRGSAGHAAGQLI